MHDSALARRSVFWNKARIKRFTSSTLNVCEIWPAFHELVMSTKEASNMNCRWSIFCQLGTAATALTSTSNSNWPFSSTSLINSTNPFDNFVEMSSIDVTFLIKSRLMTSRRSAIVWLYNFEGKIVCQTFFSKSNCRKHWRIGLKCDGWKSFKLWVGSVI